MSRKADRRPAPRRKKNRPGAGRPPKYGPVPADAYARTYDASPAEHAQIEALLRRSRSSPQRTDIL